MTGKDPLKETQGRLSKAEELLEDWRRGDGNRAFFLASSGPARDAGLRLMEKTDAFLGVTPGGQPIGKKG